MSFAVTSWKRQGNGYAWQFDCQLDQVFTSFEKAQEHQMALIVEAIDQGLGDKKTFNVTELCEQKQ